MSYVWGVLLMVVALVVYKNRSKNPSLTTPLLYVLVALMFWSAGTRLFRSETGPMITAILSYESIAAQRLGRALVADIPSGSTILVVHGELINDYMISRRNQLLGVLSGSFGDKGYELRLHSAGSSGGSDQDTEAHILRGEDLMNIIKENPHAQAIVSLLGPPYFQKIPKAESLPPLYLMPGMDELAFDLVHRGVARAAVVTRIDSDPVAFSPNGSATEDEDFDLRFELIRAR